MKIGQKLLLGFLLIAFLFTFVGYITLTQLDKIAKPLNEDIPEDIQALSDTTILDELTHLIQYYDEVLTQSARNYAFTQDKKWKQRYYAVEPKLDRIIKQAITRADRPGKEFFARVNEANIKLVEIERRSLELIDGGEKKEAIKLLENDTYWENKHIYATALKTYLGAADLAHTEAIIASDLTVNATISDLQDLIRYSKYRIFYIIFLILLSVLGISIFVSKTITNPLRILRKGMKIAGEGNLDYKVDTGSKDEIGQLSRAFDQMTGNLKQSTTSIKNLNREISERKKTENSLQKAYVQLKETQQKLVQSEKLAALCRLSTAIAHEIKSPLGSILSGIEFLEEETKHSPKEIRTALDKIKKITLDANQTLLHFLKFSLPGDLKFEKTSLKQLIEETLSLFTFKVPKDIKITTDLVDKKVSLHLDRKLIKQTILNILTNALDSIIGKGEITIKTYLFNKVNYVVEISDTGGGISKKNLENIFEPFYSTKRPGKGTGLGLFIAKTITGAHGGDIIIESKLGKGTLVKIILPTYKKETK